MSSNTNQRGNVENLEQELLTRLRERNVRGKVVFYLDLRNATWGNVGFIAVRNPKSAGWPDNGATTSSRKQAEAWVKARYTAWLSLLLKRTAEGTGNLTVAEACDEYIQSLHDDPDYGPDHNTTSNRRSVCNVHLKPKLGTQRLSALERPVVHHFLNGLKVTKHLHGETLTVDAEPRTKANVRACLQAVWHHHFPTQECPFMGIRLDKKKGVKAQRRKAAREGNIAALIPKTTFTPAEVRKILRAAVKYDDARRPNVRAVTLPNTAHVIACIVGLGTRIDELMDVRWKHVDWEARVVFIPGAKTDAAPRWVPLQDTLVPWLHELSDMQGGHPRPLDHLIRTRPGRNGRGSKKTYQGRLDRVLTQAGLKYPGKLTHIFRATFGTWAKSAGAEEEFVKWYIGHSDVFGGATDIYIESQKELIPPEHRRLILHLPSPSEVREALESE
jgi:integrase